MKLASNETLYHILLKDLSSLERQVVESLPGVIESVSDEDLKSALSDHLEETKEHQTKIDKLLENAGKSPRGRKCKGMEGILAESDGFAAATGDDQARDIAIIAGARRVEHFEVAAYLSAIRLARELELDDDAKVLREILSQEEAADEKLSAVLTQLTPTAGGADAERDRREDSPQSLQRSYDMTGRYNDDRGYRDYDDRGRGGGYEGRSRGGHHSAEMQGRDEYGQFTGYRGSSGGRGDYDRDYDDRGRGGGYEGRSRGGHHSAEMQGRDEYGQFTGYSGGRGGDYGDRDYDDRGSRRYSSGGGSRGGPDYDDRGGITDSAGRHYTRESWEHAQEGRSRGGQHSHGGYGGGYDGGRGGYDDRGDYGGGRGNYGGGRGGYDDRGGITDSAGRHYTRESWERAQEGRSLGGQHSHGGGGQYRSR